VAAVVGLVVGHDDDSAPPGVSPVTGRPDLVVIPVLPVGADTPDGKETRQEALDAVTQAARSGAGGIRVTADLNWLCEPDSCDTSPLDPVVEQARDLGLSVYMHVNSTPSWLDGRGPWYGPEGDAATRWAALFSQLVDRYGTEVAGYEVWNEPNNPEFWQQGPDPDAYADLLKAVWTTAKAIHPDVQLIGGVLSNNDLGYMHRLSGALAARGGDASNHYFYDQLGVHPYAGEQGQGYAPDRPAGSADVSTTFGTKDMTFRGVERLREQVFDDEGIWRDVVIGEFGYDTTPRAWYHVDEPQRARYLTSALRIAAGWPWLRAFSVYGYRESSAGGFDTSGTASQAALDAEIQALAK
jgi:Cellulase (glycosyl hydrolase family 5)